MHEVAKETRCTHCEHLPVCSLKEQFLAAQQAVDGVQVSLGDRSFQSLRNFDWIKPVNLDCVHFSRKIVKRDTPIQPSISGI